MYLYLVRHGEAMSGEEDPARPLSEKGGEEVGKVAAFVSSKAGISVRSIFNSGKLRAAQTANIFAEHIGPEGGVSEREGLAPMDSPETWAERLKETDEDVMLVGHLPHLARLTSLLLCGEPETAAVNFEVGGMVCLRREQDRWSIDWMIVPRMVP